MTYMPHANSKGSTPYKRTKPSTLARMKEISQVLKPKDVVATIDKEVGGIEMAASTSCLPRDKQQVKNVKRNFSPDSKDEFAAVLTRCKVDQEGFVGCVLNLVS